uniref:Putative secreted peptide n=1 Tax=Anopheles braziliensis TaxID=58242 RepID=A0A2M3ZW28_9DIPT
MRRWWSRARTIAVFACCCCRCCCFVVSNWKSRSADLLLGLVSSPGFPSLRVCLFPIVEDAVRFDNLL